MIREMNIEDREEIDKMQFELQKYFSEIDQTRESQSYMGINDAHRYMQQMLNDVKNMNGKVFVAEEKGQVVGFVQGVIIEHKKAMMKSMICRITRRKRGGLVYCSLSRKIEAVA